MSTGTKYTPEALTAMATMVLSEENSGSNRPLHLYIVVSQRTGLQPLEVRERVKQLANKEDE